jgi:hypothetical protein
MYLAGVLALIHAPQDQQPPRPTSFRIVSITPIDLKCDVGTFGYGVEVVYQVVDQNGNPMNVSGMLPQEHVTWSLGPTPPDFLPFATPRTTDPSGQFHDIPVGTCFPPPAPFVNRCIDVGQDFNIVRDGTIFRIDTVTKRRDCTWGIRVNTQTLGFVN